MTTEPKPIDALAYTTTQAAQVTGRSHTRIKKAIRERELTARKDGRATLVERAELARWIGSLRTIGRMPEQATTQNPAPVAVRGNARPAPSRARALVIEESRR